MLAQPGPMIGWTLVVTLLGFGICSLGLQKGVERITKVMMTCLLLLMLVLVVRSVTLDGAMEGLRFYLVPDFHNLLYDAEGSFILGAAIYDAMSQAFFTLSLGIGALAIFGSYIGRERSLTGEAISVGVLDTFVALIAGLIIFPACFAFGVQPDQGVGLVFMTLPNVFNQMPLGNVWGGLFFLFMSFAALSTIIAVFENIVAFAMDLGWSRKKAIVVNGAALILLSLPCVLGFNVWSGFTTPVGNIQELVDFVVSNNLLPLGSLVYLLFCTSRRGWGWKSFIEEADAGQGVKFPKWARVYVSRILPIIVLVIFVMGYYQKFFAK
jgi:NSS family neurotransmitter:Na+ symporter